MNDAPVRELTAALSLEADNPCRVFRVDVSVPGYARRTVLVIIDGDQSIVTTLLTRPCRGEPKRTALGPPYLEHQAPEIPSDEARRLAIVQVQSYLIIPVS